MGMLTCPDITEDTSIYVVLSKFLVSYQVLLDVLMYSDWMFSMRK